MEKWDAYDRFRNKLGYELVRGEKIPEGAKHIVAHMIFYNSKGQLLLQRRSETKELAPGVWAFAGGSALAGETTADACMRETQEEMGFIPDMSEAEIAVSYSRWDHIVDVYLIKTEVSVDELVLQEEEVAEARWFDRDEFLEIVKDESRFWQYGYMDMIIKYLDELPYVWGNAD